MLIGLHDAEFEKIPDKHFPNYALMKISAYHKAKGDTVEWWDWNKKKPVEEDQITFSGKTAIEDFERELIDYNSRFNRIYSSKIFDFTPENPYLPLHTVKGGTGYGVYDELPPEVDNVYPDYSIYPKCDYAIGFLTRGCIRSCDWCVVPTKEGKLRPYRTWQELVRNDTDKLVLMDNNILACQHGISQLEELAGTDYHIDINQGMDVRLISDDVCKILKRIKWIKRIRFSCDREEQLPYFEKLVELFDKYGIAKSRVFIYLLL